MDENELKKAWDKLKKIAESAGNGGYLVDINGKLCFDDDVVRIDFSDGTQIARLCYDKELRRWYFLIQETEWLPVDDSDFTKIENEEDEK